MEIVLMKVITDVWDNTNLLVTNNITDIADYMDITDNMDIKVVALRTWLLLGYQDILYIRRIRTSNDQTTDDWMPINQT